MNVIFLDVDGVLNCRYFDEKYLIDSDINQIRVDEKCIRILSKICKETNSKIVLSSSWKLSIDEFGNYSSQLKELISLFKQYNIEFYGYTPNIPNPNHIMGDCMWKELDIKEYLKNHKEVTNYCILDDEIYDLKSLKDHVVQTDYINYGIAENNIEEIKKVLKLT